jgi:hypothetical protein
MKKPIFIAAFCLATISVCGQGPRRGKEKPPVLHEVSNKEVVQSVYPEAGKVEKVNEYWYKILDANNKIIGFALSSQNFCKEVKGYYDNTPVMILTDKSFNIKKISMLSNYESPGYVRKLEKRGFFSLWDGKSLSDAKTVEADGYTGATYTAMAVKQNVDFLLNNGQKKLPKTN